MHHDGAPPRPRPTPSRRDPPGGQIFRMGPARALEGCHLLFFTGIIMDVPRDAKGRILPGYSLNPAGRPKGSKNKLATSFFDDCYAVWQESGKEALQQMLAEDPASFNRMIASTMPKELDIDSTSSDGSMTPPAEIRIFAVEPNLDDDPADAGDE